VCRNFELLINVVVVLVLVLVPMAGGGEVISSSPWHPSRFY
jgi:hypothetical protein